METVLLDEAESKPIDVSWDGDRPRLDAAGLPEALGWKLAPEGLCRGSVCVPVRDRARLESERGIDLAVFAETVGRPIVIDPEERVVALGAPAAERAARLRSGEAPDFTLPDLDGRSHTLAGYRGKKVLLIAWASW